MNTSGEKPTAGEAPRRHGRRRFLRRLKDGRSGSRLVERCRQLSYAWDEWWRPPSKQGYPGYGYGYYGGHRSNRLSRAWHHLRRGIRGSAPARLLRALHWRFHEWWYPPSRDVYPSYGYYGHARRSRLTRARRRFRRAVLDSPPARWWRAIYLRLYAWWCPVSDDPYP